MRAGTTDRWVRARVRDAYSLEDPYIEDFKVTVTNTGSHDAVMKAINQGIRKRGYQIIEILDHASKREFL